jgi:hypothetical protein
VAGILHTFACSHNSVPDMEDNYLSEFFYMSMYVTEVVIVCCKLQSNTEALVNGNITFTLLILLSDNVV